MKSYMRSTLVLLTMVVAASFAAPAFADGIYAAGYVSPDGYTWRDGYWWKGDASYTRAAVQSYYYQNGCRYAYTSYSYTLVPSKKVTITPQSEDNWRARLLEIAKERDRWEGNLRASALEQNEFLESVKALGLDGNFRWNGYGYEIQYAKGYRPAVAQYDQLVQPQGATVYGVKEVADIYGNVNIGQIYQQALRLRADSRAYEAEGDKGTTALVDNLGHAAAAVAEIQAKGAATVKILSELRPESRARILRELSIEHRGQAGGGSVVPQNGGGSDALAAAQATANNRCVSCHRPDKKLGDLDMTNLSLLSNDQARKILEAINHADPQRRMPRGPDNTVGTPLTEEEKATFYIAIYGAK